MRKLAWFSVGFAAACLFACYGVLGAASVVAAAALWVLSMLLWQAVRPRPGEPPVFLRRPEKTGKRPRYVLYQLSRRSAALCLGGLVALGWSAGYDAVFRVPAKRWVGDEVGLSGEVSSYPGSTSVGGWSVSVRLDGGPAAPDVLVYGAADWGGLKPGDQVSFCARVTPSTRLYGDETTYYTARGVYLLAYCNTPPEVVPAQGVPVRYWPALCARALRAGISAAFDETAAPIAIAVTLGDKSGLDEQLYSALSRTGLMHTAAVSGLHISLLVAAALGLLGNRRSVALATVPLLLLYALMAGGTPSALRAVFMQAALLAAPVLRRKNDGPSSLGLALLILLLQNPFAAASVSLQLSFAAVAGVMLATPALSRRMLRPLWRLRRRLEGRRWGRRLWKGIAAVLSETAVCLGAMLFTVPLIALYFGRITLISPLSGILTLWALSLLLVCALFLGALAIFLPGPAAVLGTAAGLLGHFARWIALGLGKLPFASLSVDNRYCLIWLAAVYLALLTGAVGREKFPRPAVPAVSLALLLCAAVGLGRLETNRADLTVTALDVGQGASTALVSGGQTALVDCGGSGSSSPGDVAADYFASMGRFRLDLLVLTHFDSDHFNGVEQLFYRMEVRRVAIPGSGVDPADAALIAQMAELEGAELIVVDETIRFFLGRGTLTLFPPLGEGTTNESGLFALCSADGFDALITGDADAYVEKMLVKYCPIPDIELLLVGHHGSKSSTCAELLSAARPELAVISVGYNSYGHPDPAVLERLEEAGAQVYRTDLEGTVSVAVRDGRVRIS